MTALLAQAASSGEWYDGWQLAVIIVTVVVSPMLALIGWLHRQMSRGFADSKSDLAAAEERLEGNIAEVKTDLKAEIVAAEKRLEGNIAEVKTDLKAEIVAAEKRLEGNIAEVKTDLTGKIAEVRGDLAATEKRLSADIAEVRTDIASVDGDLKDLKNKLYEDALGKVAMYQWQLAAPQPSASEAPSSQPQSQQPAPQPKQLAETSTD